MEISSLSMLALMFLLHFFADFNLQLQAGMDKFKQKKWWDDQIPKNRPDLRIKYGCDYRVGLVCHGMFWALVVCLPLLMRGGDWYFWQALVNGIIHSDIDDLKANQNLINLAQDQAMHVVQILLIWSCWVIW